MENKYLLSEIAERYIEAKKSFIKSCGNYSDYFSCLADYADDYLADNAEAILNECEEELDDYARAIFDYIPDYGGSRRKADSVVDNWWDIEEAKDKYESAKEAYDEFEDEVTNWLEADEAFSKGFRGAFLELMKEIHPFFFGNEYLTQSPIKAPLDDITFTFEEIRTIHNAIAAYQHDHFLPKRTYLDQSYVDTYGDFDKFMESFNGSDEELLDKLKYLRDDLVAIEHILEGTAGTHALRYGYDQVTATLINLICKAYHVAMYFDREVDKCINYLIDALNEF